MKDVDYAPCNAPSPDRQRDALSKGLGRAVEWAANGRLDHKVLLQACVQDQRFDHQVDSPRGDWLWRMMQRVDGLMRFREPILHALQKLDDESSASQLCQLARCYAEDGDALFRKRLYEIVEQKPFARVTWLGEEDLVALDGEEGFLFAAQIRGRQLAKREWDCDDESLMVVAADHIGMDRANDLLKTALNEDIQRFFTRRTQKQRAIADRGPAVSHAARMAAIAAGDILKSAQTPGSSWLLRAWGKQASENDLGTVLQSLWIAREPLVVANLLRVFAARRVPDFDLRLIDLCHSDDSAVRRNAFVAISNIAHSAVRDFALRQLQTSPDDWLVLSLFHRNYRPRDEHLLFEAAELPHAVCEVHWFLMAFIDLLEMNPGADASRLGPLIYFLTPCEHCRFRAFRLLRRRKSDPAWMVRECRADANEECRELANGDSIDPPTEGGAA